LASLASLVISYINDNWTSWHEEAPWWGLLFGYTAATLAFRSLHCGACGSAHAVFAPRRVESPHHGNHSHHHKGPGRNHKIVQSPHIAAAERAEFSQSHDGSNAKDIASKIKQAPIVLKSRTTTYELQVIEPSNAVIGHDHRGGSFHAIAASLTSERGVGC
jgi:hypothetical protein